VHLLAQAQQLTLPQVDWRAIAPELALLVTGVVVLLWVAFVPTAAPATAAGGAGGAPEARTARGLPAARLVAVLLTLAGLGVAAWLTWSDWDQGRVAFESAFSQDGITRYTRAILIAVGALSTLMIANDTARDRLVPAELLPLSMFALAGMSLLAAASDLLIAFIALEILSLSLYTMAGAVRRQAAQEAAMKYFLLGAFSSAFLVYGIALVYGATGATNLRAIAAATASVSADTGLLLAGVALLGVGFLFKVAAVPFHMWTPDVYQGAPTSVTAFMAAGTKAAGFAAFLRVFVGGLGGLTADWRPAIAAIAVLTMVVGAVVAVVQTDVKRVLAYSSIAHAGFLMIGLAAATPEGISAAMFYLLAYAFMVMGAFMVVQYASRADGTDAGGRDGAERTSLDDYRGFGRRHPVAGGLLALFLFSLAGIPPALSGFWAKYFVFQAGVDAGLTWLVVVGVVTSVIAAFFYLRIAVVAFLQEPEGVEEERPATSPVLGLALGLAAVVSVAIGLAPQALVDAARAAGVILG
jgi:NADH-quinone oxidoreductase subunit N